ncbi:hypothetical protein L7F22_036775 [Adiantum nelumboides]|nr:hypothetical protein [Adiantum nelumboides]
MNCLEVVIWYFVDDSRLFVAQIFRLHGMPETIVSDRDPRFTSLFWKAIWENIGTRLHVSSSFHPQTNGQSEIANSVVLDLLKSYISDQKTKWERYLLLVEFAYNNMIHSSTRKAPFEIVEGAMKVPPFLSTKDKIFEADEYTRDLDTTFAKVVLQPQREAHVGTSRVHVGQKKAKACPIPSQPKPQEQNPPDSPQFSFMRDLDDIVPPEDMFLEEPLQQEAQLKPRLVVNKESRGMKKKHHKKNSHKQKTFKSGDKDVKFDSFNGRRGNDKALAFIRQFEVAFAEGNFKEKSKLRHVGMYLKGTTNSWWLTQILENRKPQGWKAFKKAFYAQFLPPDFEQEVKKEWNRFSQSENETVSQYVDRFWDVLLKVTPFKKIEDSEKMRKFEAGLHDALQKAMKLYPRNMLQTLQKLEKSVDAGNYYEAQQMYKTIYARYVAAKNFGAAVDLLQSGASVQLRHGQVTCGVELGILLVESLGKARMKYDTTVVEWSYCVKFSEPYVLPSANARLQPIESASNWHTNAFKEIAELQYDLISKLEAMKKAKHSAAPAPNTADVPELLPLSYSSTGSSSIMPCMFLTFQSSTATSNVCLPQSSASPFSDEDLADAFNPFLRWGSQAQTIAARNDRYARDEMLCQLHNPEDYLWRGFMDDHYMPYEEQLIDELDSNLANAYREADSTSESEAEVMEKNSTLLK